jgi:hypothetical protein
MNLLTDRSGRMVDGRPAPADHPADNAQSEVVNNQ